MIVLSNVEVKYFDVILVLKGVSLEVPDGKIVALLGANGAGKTTTLRAISGMLRIEQGRCTDGYIELDGERIDKMNPEEIVKRGIVQVFEGRPIFEHLTTEENLLVGAVSRGDGANIKIKEDLRRVYSYFPKLEQLSNSTSGYLSGGERQMLVMGRAMMAHPSVMLLDEPSMGLSPILAKEIFNIVRQINADEKTSILLVEQNARLALGLAEYGYVMENGRVVLDGSAKNLRENEDIKEFYLGLSEIGKRKSYREVKHYKRRKRWLG